MTPRHEDGPGSAVRLFPPTIEPAPAIFDSPHSGRTYPEDFSPAVAVADLHGYEDRLVDTLIVDAPAHGIALLTADFPRAYIDPNRAEDDLEPEITGPDWADPTTPLYASKGIGLIFRTSLAGTPIYERPLGSEEIGRRLTRYWRPYHEALDAALGEIQRTWGAVWHVNWHSMRPIGDVLSSDPGAVRPDFVLSDRDGTSTEPGFMDMAEQTLRDMGFSVARNRPFKGGYITALHGRPREGRHSLQVEINRGLYLDLDTLEVTPGAESLRRNLSCFAAEVAAYARSSAPFRGC